MLTIKKTTQLTEKELETIMAIWLQTNLEAHPFVAPTYWQENKAFVRAALPKATLILAEEEGQIIGFLGLMDNYIASGGATTPLAKIIYIIVGICAIYSIKFLAPLFREP